jgi:hypothetical protein
MSRIVIIPGLAVQRYAQPAVAALLAHGHSATLLDPPGWPGRPPELDRYGRAVADQLAGAGRRVDLLVGLSVGTQAAAVAAACGAPVERLLLISPTVGPERRTRRSLLAGWLHGEDHPDSPPLRIQVPDWRRAGPARIYRTFASVLAVPLEEVLPGVSAPVTIAHADHDNLTSHAYAAFLAERHHADFLVLPDAPHSWPIGDEQHFATLVARLLDD